MQRRPNILWIQTDEQRPDSLGCYGSAWARTPHIDDLAKRGTVFLNAVCQSPVCLPSRCSQNAARYPQEFACLNNMLLEAGETFPADIVTFPELFHRTGYDTANFGRYHALSETIFETNVKTPDALPSVCTPFGLSKTYDEQQYHVIKRPGKHHRPLIIAGTYPPDENPCNLSTDRVIAYLYEKAKGDKPFLLRVSYNWPHTPTLAPPPYDRLYDPDDLPIRYYNEAAYAGRSRFDRAYADLHRMKDLSAEQTRQVWKDYMGLCAYVDSEVGRVMAALDELGLRDNTIVMYSSDHGKMLGEWGTGEKGSFDREVWRVPFIWSWPGQIPEQATRSEGCELIDTARTLLTLTGLEDIVPESYRGRHLFGGGAAPDSVFGATRPPIQDIPDFDPDLFRVAVLTSKYRMDLNWRMDGQLPTEDLQDGNLFDLEEDPHEIVNKYSDSSLLTVRAELHALLADWLRRTGIDPRLMDRHNAGRLF